MRLDPNSRANGLCMQKLRTRSVGLRDMIDEGQIGLVGAMNDIGTGKVTFYE